MTWMSADFRAYPARCFTIHREACLNPNTSTFAGVFRTRSEANSEALMLRKFRYLVRTHPGVDFSLDKLLTQFTFRTRIEVNSFGDASLYLLARTEIAKELLSLNPDLAGILS